MNIGLQPLRVEVEAVAYPGIPNLHLVGLAAKAVNEAKERITAALHAIGIRLKARRMVVNLAPADIAKTETSLDLAIAVALLIANKERPLAVNRDDAFIGELALDGFLKPTRTCIAQVLAAEKLGFKRLWLPSDNLEVAAGLSSLELIPLRNLSEIWSAKAITRRGLEKTVGLIKKLPQKRSEISFSVIIGQNLAKRALQIALAGQHHILLIGPPGSGKSMLAKAAATYLPLLKNDDSRQVLNLYSLAGRQQEMSLDSQMGRPVRSPHHTISFAGLIGGVQMLPGEISLAHLGVLFLDELPEFNRRALEALRQPLENGEICLHHSRGSSTFPASFMLIATANPCACGWFGSIHKKCHCSQNQLLNYQRKFSGPLLDRIDLIIPIFQEKARESNNLEFNFDDNKIRDTISCAWQRQSLRFKNKKRFFNGQQTSDSLIEACRLDHEAAKMLVFLSNKHHLSNRGRFSLLRVAQTIADLNNDEEITTSHLIEAINYKTLNRFLPGYET